MAEFDKVRFWRRVHKLRETWRAGDPSFWPRADALALLHGKTTEDAVADTLSVTVQHWLLGYELDSTLLLLTQNKLVAVCSKKKAKLIQDQLADAKLAKGLSLEVIVKTKAHKADGFASLLAQVKTLVRKDVPDSQAQVVVGSTLKHRESGPFAKAFYAAFGGASSAAAAAAAAAGSGEYRLVEVRAGIQQAMHVKDDDERKAIEDGAAYTCRVLKKFLLARVEDVVDQEKKVTHEKLAKDTEAVIWTPKKVKAKVDADDVDVCYVPIVQSSGTSAAGGGKSFDLRISAKSTAHPLATSGAVIMQLGTRYKQYCTNVARTYFFNPTDEHKMAYALLVEVYRECIQALRVGNTCGAVWSAAMATIDAKAQAMTGVSPDVWKQRFTSSCGWGMGLQFRDSSLVLNADNAHVLRAGMVFCLRLGFAGMHAGTSKEFAVLLSDMMAVTEDDDAEPLTHTARSYEKVVYVLDNGDAEDEEEEEEDDDDDDDDGDVHMTRSRRPATRSRTTRGAGNPEEQQKAALAMQRHQLELEAELIEKRVAELKGDGDDDEGKDSAGNGNGAAGDDDDDEEDDPINSYDSALKIPSRVRLNQVHVDEARETVVCPIYGQFVPFHILTIKSVQKSDMSGYTYLRINFLTPMRSIAATRRSDLPKQADPKSIFVQELSYRSRSEHLSRVYFKINELRKRVQQRKKDKQNRESVVEQRDLILLPRGQKVPRLRDVSVKPSVARGKQTGSLFAHKNGIRYRPVNAKASSVDIVYENIKHAIFQPAKKNTLNVILHFHLHNEILINRSKTKYLHVYYNVMDASLNLSASRAGGDDGVREELAESRLRKKWNERFRRFSLAVEHLSAENSRRTKVEFDIPYDNLAFQGVPQKERVRLMPTVHALVALEDNPPLVISLEDIDIIVFERMRLSLRECDMTLVFKDWTRDPHRIDAIDRKSTDYIKTWIDGIGSVFYEMPSNLNWKAILQTAREDEEDFWEQGGWRFLRDPSEFQEESEDDDDPADESSEFEPSDVDDYDEEEDDYESDEYVDEDEEEDDDYVEEEEEEGQDWDELEKEALRDDRRKTLQMREASSQRSSRSRGKARRS